ncbi:hypothetical protein [Streptomyces cyaneofuscatus]|uniref:hypothetical protein n=1 Tax=Streptomyces cyaneofuscatus TaxID=66883 RepID=UPI0036678608
MPLTFVFADTTTAKVDNAVAVLEQDGRRYWAPRRYDSLSRLESASGVATPHLLLPDQP